MSARWLSAFTSDLPRIVADLEALVRLESPSDHAEHVSLVARWVHDRLRERGVPAELRPCPPRGDAVLASVAYRDGGTLLLGHLDTVWPVGTLAEMPWRLEAGRASGPGVFDMKAGIVVGMAVLAAMVRESRALPVSLLLVPDEEVGSQASREMTVSVARRHRRVLVLEPSLDGAAKVARKGCGVFQVGFRGRAAHAGLEPEKGASALVELSRFVAFLDTLAAPDLGTTLTATVARAGSVSNVVPEAAQLTVDARAWSRAEAERVSAGIAGYRPAVEGVSVGVEGGFDRPPLEPTTAVRGALRPGAPAGRGRGPGARRRTRRGCLRRQLRRGRGRPDPRRPRPARRGSPRPRRARARRGPAGPRRARRGAGVGALGPAFERRDPDLERRVRGQKRQHARAARDLERRELGSTRVVDLALERLQPPERPDHGAAPRERGAPRVGAELARAREPGGDHRADQAEGDLRGDEHELAREHAEERGAPLVVARDHVAHDRGHDVRRDTGRTRSRRPGSASS